MHVQLLVRAAVSGIGRRCDHPRQQYAFFAGEIGVLDWRNAADLGTCIPIVKWDEDNGTSPVSVILNQLEPVGCEIEGLRLYIKQYRSTKGRP
jgi:hypothetical protein